MAYSQNIPQQNDRLKDSQSDILANFQELYTFLNVNHEIFASPAGQGKHKFLSMPVQNPVPAAPTGTDGQLYTALGAVSGVTELFWRRNPAGSLRPLTEGSVNNPGWSMLPSGLMIKWGFSTITGAGAVIYPVAGPIPSFGGVVAVMVTPSDNTLPFNDQDVAVRVQDFSTNPLQFTAYASPRTTLGPKQVTFSWVAFGTRA